MTQIKYPSMTDETNPLPLRLPCKWIRPIRDVFVGCWNKEKVQSILKDQTVGVLGLEDRSYCRGEVDSTPDCWEGLQQKCIDHCKHYAVMNNFKYGKLKGFCTKQCKKFELFEPNLEHENLYKDFDDLDILEIIGLSKVKYNSKKFV